MANHENFLGCDQWISWIWGGLAISFVMGHVTYWKTIYKWDNEDTIGCIYIYYVAKKITVECVNGVQNCLFGGTIHDSPQFPRWHLDVFRGSSSKPHRIPTRATNHGIPSMFSFRYLSFLNISCTSWYFRKRAGLYVPEKNPEVFTNRSLQWCWQHLCNSIVPIQLYHIVRPRLTTPRAPSAPRPIIKE